MAETDLWHAYCMEGVQMHDGRVDWVDYAKGFCIIFVVMMHSTLGVEAAAGKPASPEPKMTLQPAE